MSGGCTQLSARPAISSPVDWQPNAQGVLVPRSHLVNDIYRSSGPDGQGGLAQAQYVFLGGCELLASAAAPLARWQGQAHWHILETGFGLGLNFLAAWQAWREDAARPAVLQFSSLEAYPVKSTDILQSAASYSALHPLAAQLGAAWQAAAEASSGTLASGQHRFVFEHGAVILHLHIGLAQAVLPTLTHAVDSIFLDGFNPALQEAGNEHMWSVQTMQTLHRLAQAHTLAASWTVAASVRQAMQAAGFVVSKRPGLPPKRHCLQARVRSAFSALV